MEIESKEGAKGSIEFDLSNLKRERVENEKVEEIQTW